jgi:hypothetical protein
MGTGASLLPRALRKKTSWGGLTLDEKEKVATHLVVGAFYPPPPASSTKKSAIAIAAIHKTRRIRAARALLTETRAPLLDNAMSALISARHSRDAKVLRKLIEPVAQLWRKGLLGRLLRQASLRVYNETKPTELWTELANPYLVAVALIRQRHEHARSPRVRDSGLRRATWLVTETYPQNCEYAYARSKLETFIRDRRGVWPLVCALVYQIARRRNIDLDSTEPLHQLLPPTPPSARELINCFLEAPAIVFSAATYFEEQLCQPSSLREQLRPPLSAADCTSLPPFVDLEDKFTTPPAFMRLSPPELELAKKYRSSLYK